MNFQDVLTSDVALTLVAAFCAAVWTALKSTVWYGRFRENRFALALTALEAGIEETYREYVQALKEGRADGKLTADEKRCARDLARDRAVEIARSEGLDLIRELGPAFVDLYLAKLVKALKASAVTR